VSLVSLVGAEVVVVVVVELVSLVPAVSVAVSDPGSVLVSVTWVVWVVDGPWVAVVRVVMDVSLSLAWPESLPQLVPRDRATQAIQATQWRRMGLP